MKAAILCVNESFIFFDFCYANSNIIARRLKTSVVISVLRFVQSEKWSLVAFACGARSTAVKTPLYNERQQHGGGGGGGGSSGSGGGGGGDGDGGARSSVFRRACAHSQLQCARAQRVKTKRRRAAAAAAAVDACVLLILAASISSLRADGGDGARRP